MKVKYLHEIAWFRSGRGTYSVTGMAPGEYRSVGKA